MSHEECSIKLKIYKFYWDCDRMGYLEGIFVAETKEVEAMIGKEIYFGEVLGKHSEIFGVLEEKDFKILTDDQDFISKAIELNIVPMGYNPLNCEE